jgi:hypothetical protein
VLIINCAPLGSTPFVRAALAASQPVRVLSYWEQISALEVRGDQSLLAVDDYVVPETEPIFFFAPPRFASPPPASADLDFGWSEWNASLTAVLSLRRKVIPNGEVLIFTPNLAANPLAFLHRFGRAASISCRPGGNVSAASWLIAARSILLPYPERMIAPFLGKGVEAALYNLLVEAKLDYAILELKNMEGEVALTRLHLAPPTHAPFELHLTLARLFGAVA